MIIITPHKLNYEEEQGLRQIEKIYSKSLVTVFNRMHHSEPHQGFLCKLSEGCDVDRYSGERKFWGRE